MRSATMLGIHSSSGVCTLPHHAAWMSASTRTAAAAWATVMPAVWSTIDRRLRSSITMTKSAVPGTIVEW